MNKYSQGYQKGSSERLNRKIAKKMGGNPPQRFETLKGVAYLIVMGVILGLILSFLLV